MRQKTGGGAGAGLIRESIRDISCAFAAFALVVHNQTSTDLRTQQCLGARRVILRYAPGLARGIEISAADQFVCSSRIEAGLMVLDRAVRPWRVIRLDNGWLYSR